MRSRFGLLAAMLAALATAPAALPVGEALAAEEKEIGRVNTAATNLGLTRSHRVVVVRFDDPKIEGVSCWISHAQTGGVSGTLGIAADPSRFALDCRATGPIRSVASPGEGERGETVFERDTSLFFKETQVTRFWDADRRALVYLAWSTRLVDGSPYSAVSVVARGAQP